MAKIAEKSPATKGRQTKLGKKSAEELIQIILRKDKTEKSLSTQVINLKAEINAANKKLECAKRDMEGTIKTLHDTCDKKEEDIKVITERADKLYKDLTNAELEHDLAVKNNVELGYTVQSLKRLCIVLGVYSIAVTLFCIFC